MNHSRDLRAVGAVYRALLRCYPRAFRERFGEEMAATFMDAFRARRGRWARVRFVIGATIDACWTGLAERASGWRSGSRRTLTPTSGDTAMQSILQDLRFAVRSLGRRPGFVAAVVVTLALGIGANTAIFSLIDAVLLHPLPTIAHSEQVVAVYHGSDARSPYGNVSYPVFKAMASRTRSLADLAGFATLEVSVRAHQRAEPLSAGVVSGNYFTLLGITPQVGRLLVPADDDVPGAHPVVVLSNAFWTREFGRDPHAVGSTIQIGSRPFTIVGVAPAEFRGTRLASAPELWVPLTMITSLGEGGLFSTAGNQVFTTPRFNWVALVGRLRPGVTLQHVTAELNTITAAVDQELASASASPSGTPRRMEGVKNAISIVPITQAAALNDRDSLVRFVGILLAVVVLTLLIACVNVANLMLVRSSERGRELGLRAALGASRVRIARQLVLESVGLASIGAVVGLAVGALTMHVLSAFTLPGDVVLGHVHLALDGRVLTFTIALTLATALLFGLVPAIRASRPDLAAMFKAQGSAARRAPRGMLVGIQVAISVVLLVGAALFVRSLRAGLTTDLGFDPTPLAAVGVDLRLQGYSSARTNAYYDQAIERARGLPGVTAAAVGTQVPLAETFSLPFTVSEGLGEQGRDSSIIAGAISISPGYFNVLNVPLIAGRSFASSDDRDAPQVAIVNETAAHVFAPTGSVLGRRLAMFRTDTFTVVGVVRDTKYASVRDDHIPVVFVPIEQESPLGGASIITRSDRPARTLVALRKTLADIDPAVPLRDARIVADQIDSVLMPQRFGAALLGIFAIISLCVSAVGIYGVIAYAVAQRASEIAVRIALGAQNTDIVRLVLVRTGIAVAAGGAIGLGVSMFATRTLGRFLYGITPLDSVAFISATLLLALVATLAGWLPAARATRIDPMTTLRSE